MTTAVFSLGWKIRLIGIKYRKLGLFVRGVDPLIVPFCEDGYGCAGCGYLYALRNDSAHGIRWLNIGLWLIVQAVSLACSQRGKADTSM